MKRLSKITAVLSVLILLVSVLSVFAQAQSEQENIQKKDELTVISANVAGLPIPSFFSENKRNVPSSQLKLGKMLNNSGADVVCVQEDFQFNFMLTAGLKDYPYKTYTSGGVPVGDGLNVFSKYPIYNIERVAWEEFNGILRDGNDGLTPKGFLKCTLDMDGILIDLYNVHVDAYGAEADQYAKKAQLIQLAEYIKQNSADRPVIVTGDMNLTLHTDYLAEYYSIIIEENGFEDAWAETENGGNYLRGADASALINEWYAKYNGLYWGRWDSVERLIYKDGGGVTFNPTSFEYDIYSDTDDEKALTDHCFMVCTMEIDSSEYDDSRNIELVRENQPTIMYRIIHGTKMVIRCLSLLLPEAFDALVDLIRQS